MAEETQELKRAVIDLRMKEYETLRNEVTQRINARQQMAGYAAAITAITATWGGELGPWRFLVVAVVIIGSVGYLRDSNKAIQRIGLYLQELESEINELGQELYGRMDSLVGNPAAGTARSGNDRVAGHGNCRRMASA